MAITVEMREQVSQLYVALFGRAPDGEGLGFWVQQLNSGQTLAQVADAMYATAPARDYYPSFLTNGEIVASFYVNVLGREADAEGLAFWTAKLNAAGATPGSVITEMINVVANYGGTSEAGLQSAALFNNKVVVAQYYAEQNGTIEGATTVLTGVTADPATVDDAIADIDDGTVGGVQQGETFVLTVDPDNITGTNGNDTIVVPYSNALGATVTTWQAFDKVNGGDGDDKMEIYVKGDANSSQAGTVDGVEVITVFNDEAGVFFGGSGGINAAKFVGAKEIWQVEGYNDVSNLSSSTVAGFRGSAPLGYAEQQNFNVQVSNLTVAADAASTSINIELDRAEMVDEGTAYFNIEGDALNSLNLAGTFTFHDYGNRGPNAPLEQGVVQVFVDGGKGDTFTLGSSLDVSLDLAVDNFHIVDASKSTGGVEVSSFSTGILQTVTTGSGDDSINQTGFITTATKAATYTTGAGDDEIDVGTDGVGTTTIDSGADDDFIFVNDTSKTLVVNGGAGDDVLAFGEDFETAGDTATAKITADMGAGDDEVSFGGLVMADLPASWVLDGGDGVDSVFIGGGSSRTFVAGDYITLTESLKNFEKLTLDAFLGEDFTFDASRLSSYKDITVTGGEDDHITVTKAAADQTIGIDADSWSHTMTLDVTAAGYVAASDPDPVVFGGDLKVAATAWDGQFLAVTAKGNTVNLTVDAGDDAPLSDATSGGVIIDGDFKVLNAVLNAEIVHAPSETEGGPDGPAVDVEQVSLELYADSGNLSGLTTVSLTGVGEAGISNYHGAKLATIDASALSNITWDGTNEVVKTTGLGLDYTTTNDAVAETIKLGTGYDEITFSYYDNGTADRWASSYAKMDKVENFTMVATSADVATVDFDKSDLIYVDSGLVGAPAVFEKLGTTAAATVSGAASLGLALQTVAQNTTQDFVVFQYGGNTYIYGDTGGLSGADIVTTPNDQLDDTDLVIQLTGTVSLDLLLQSLNPVPA